MNSLSTLQSGGVAPFVIGMLLISLAGLLSYALRRAPTTLFRFLKSRYIITATLKESNSHVTQDIQNILEWYTNTKFIDRCRSFSVERKLGENRPDAYRAHEKEGIIVLPGLGRHYFFFERRFAWLTVSAKSNDKNDTTTAARTVELNFIGRDRHVFSRFLTQCTPHARADLVKIFSSLRKTRSEWELQASRVPRRLTSVAINGTVKKDICVEIETFFAREKWYEEKGFNHKLAYLFYGPPGTGKTSLIFAVASHFAMPVYNLSLSGLTGRELVSLVRQIPQRSALVIEDIDVSQASEKREEVDTTQPATPTMPKPQMEGLSMSALLNAIDGIASATGLVIMITTNHIDKLDPALIRKGRIDHLVHLGLLDDSSIRQYLNLHYPQAKLLSNQSSCQFQPILGAELQALYLEHTDSLDNLLAVLPVEGSQ